MIFGIFGLLVSLLPVIVGILILLHMIRTLDAIGADVRRIADRLEPTDQVTGAD